MELSKFGQMNRDAVLTEDPTNELQELFDLWKRAKKSGLAKPLIEESFEDRLKVLRDCQD